MHDGFQKTFGRTSDSVLSGVQSALTSTGVNKLLVTGHSLGAAIATMDALMLRLNLPSSVQMTTTVFGLPRGGDQAYANFIDATVSSSLPFPFLNLMLHLEARKHILLRNESTRPSPYRPTPFPLLPALPGRDSHTVFQPCNGECDQRGGVPGAGEWVLY